MTIRHVVFDIGRVLVHWDPEIPYRRLIPDDRERAAFLAEVCTAEWNLEQDRGRSWADAEAELLAVHPGKEALIRAFRLHWHEMVPHALDETVTIYRRLIEQGADVTLLTNFAADTYEEAAERFPFLGEARGVTVSGRIAQIKPDRTIFEHHAATFALDPAATFFVDDNAANVAGACAAGWDAVLFTDAPTLRADLGQRGFAV